MKKKKNKDVVLPKPSFVTRGGRPPRRRLPGLAAALGFRLGLAECDASFCDWWLFRDEVGMTDINPVGLLNISDISDLTKELSKIGGKLLELAWSESRAQFFVPFVHFVSSAHRLFGVPAGCEDSRACLFFAGA